MRIFSLLATTLLLSSCVLLHTTSISFTTIDASALYPVRLEELSFDPPYEFTTTREERLLSAVKTLAVAQGLPLLLPDEKGEPRTFLSIHVRQRRYIKGFSETYSISLFLDLFTERERLAHVLVVYEGPQSFASMDLLFRLMEKGFQDLARLIEKETQAAPKKDNV
ncbi:hypothetical protein [Spirochaeta thermophila]|uniref:Lipoprotein n=1 Tax=Winmispira thermophila (strain ATCC 49972 / DSM 6192 / RI 19.B1) TaxID=665571 RepID=E0RQI2_WINT6|nr:hypothetical protein [Spirochaeta thermophila]ADN02958.1 hypothetical protein STHERM_c20230 [Spirochaeta thermophila DSM 6192]